MKTTLEIKMPDGSVWGVPVMVIAKDRAANYANEFGGDVERSLVEDTLPLFEAEVFEIKDWAANNMNWSDVKHAATRIRPPDPLTDADFQEAWVNGEKFIR